MRVILLYNFKLISIGMNVIIVLVKFIQIFLFYKIAHEIVIHFFISVIKIVFNYYFINTIDYALINSIYNPPKKVFFKFIYI